MTVTSSTVSNYKYDLFGSPFRFFIHSKKSKTFKTAVGGLSTTAYIVFCSLALFIFVRKFLDRSKATVSVNTTIQARDHYYDTYFNDVFLLLGMFDGQNFPKTEETLKFMTIHAQRETTFLDQQDIQIKRKIEAPFPMVKCEHLNHNWTDLTTEAYSLDSGSFYRGSIFCGDIIGNTNWWLQGSPLELPYTMIRYRLYPCSLDDPADCASVNELAAASVVVPLFLKSVDYSNYSSPLKNGVDSDVTLSFNVITKSKMTLWFKDTTIHDDKIDFVGEFGEPNKFIELDKVTSTTGTRNGALHCTKIQIEDGNCDPYIEIVVRVSTTHTVVERRYYTFLEMISEVGGFTDLILLVLLFGTTWYNEYWQAKWIREQLYRDLLQTIKENNRKNKQKNSMKRIGSGDGQGLPSEHRDQFLDNDHVSRPSKAVLKGVGTSQNRAIFKTNLKELTKESNQGVMEELRVEFDTFEFLTASRKSSILEDLYLKPFHRVLLPQVLYNIWRSTKNPKNKNNKFRKMRSLFYERALSESKNNITQERKRPTPDPTNFEENLHETFMKILSVNGTMAKSGTWELGSGIDNELGSQFGAFGGIEPAKNPTVIFNSQPEESEEKGSNLSYFDSFLKMASKQNKKQEKIADSIDGHDQDSIKATDLDSLWEEPDGGSQIGDNRHNSKKNQPVIKSLAKNKSLNPGRGSLPSKNKMVLRWSINNKKGQKIQNNKNKSRFGRYSLNKKGRSPKHQLVPRNRKISTKLSEEDIDTPMKGRTSKASKFKPNFF